MKKHKTWHLLVALLAVLALVAAGCGDDDDDTAAPAETSSTTGGSDDGGGGEVEGCGEGASTDPSNMEVGREVARCEPGAPAPNECAASR